MREEYSRTMKGHAASMVSMSRSMRTHCTMSSACTNALLYTLSAHSLRGTLGTFSEYISCSRGRGLRRQRGG